MVASPLWQFSHIPSDDSLLEELLVYLALRSYFISICVNFICVWELLWNRRKYSWNRNYRELICPLIWIHWLQSLCCVRSPVFRCLAFPIHFRSRRTYFVLWLNMFENFSFKFFVCLMSPNMKRCIVIHHCSGYVLVQHGNVFAYRMRDCDKKKSTHNRAQCTDIYVFI